MFTYLSICLVFYMEIALYKSIYICHLVMTQVVFYGVDFSLIFTHSSFDVHLSCFHFFVNEDYAVTIQDYRSLFNKQIGFPLDIFPVLGCLDHLVVQF